MVHCRFQGWLAALTLGSPSEFPRCPWCWARHWARRSAMILFPPRSLASDAVDSSFLLSRISCSCAKLSACRWAICSCSSTARFSFLRAACRSFSPLPTLPRDRQSVTSSGLPLLWVVTYSSWVGGGESVWCNRCCWLWPQCQWVKCTTLTTGSWIDWLGLWPQQTAPTCSLYPALNTLRPRQNGHHFSDDILKWIFLYENVWISIEISLKFVPKGQINNIPALVQIMAWRHPGDKPLSEPIMVSLLTHICVTRPQWVNNPRTQGLIVPSGCPPSHFSPIQHYPSHSHESTNLQILKTSVQEVISIARKWPCSGLRLVTHPIRALICALNSEKVVMPIQVPSGHPGTSSQVPSGHPGTSVQVSSGHPGTSAEVPSGHPDIPTQNPNGHPDTSAHWVPVGHPGIHTHKYPVAI